LTQGGSLVVLECLLESMARLRPDIEWALAAHGSLRFSRNPPANLVRVDIGDIDRSRFGAPRWYELGLPSAVVRLGVDVVFSLTNYLPIRRLPCPTVLLVQHAGHFSDASTGFRPASETSRSHRGLAAENAVGPAIGSNGDGSDGANGSPGRRDRHADRPFPR